MILTASASVSTPFSTESLASFEYSDYKFNILDTPCLFDFAAEMIEGIRAADTVLITVSAKSGVKVGARKAYEEADKALRGKQGIVSSAKQLEELRIKSAKQLPELVEEISLTSKDNKD